MTQSGQKMAKAALFLSFTVVLSRILGYGREVALYTIFGQNYVTDAYQAAFSIPDSLYMLLIGGALGSALIPVFSAHIASGRDSEAWKAASVVFNYILLALSVLLLLAYRYTEPVIHVLAPGLDESAIAGGVSPQVPHVEGACHTVDRPPQPLRTLDRSRRLVSDVLRRSTATRHALLAGDTGGALGVGVRHLRLRSHRPPRENL